MILLIAFAFMAGVVTVLSPCILPVLPVVLSGSIDGGKARPWGIIGGFISSFTVFTLTLSALTRALGIPADALRLLAGATILLFGVVMVVPALKEGFSSLVRAASAIATIKGSASSRQGQGFPSGFALGISLGLVWTPCVGPIMASVISLSLSGQTDAGSVFITLAYSAGTALPLFLIMKGGRGLLKRFSFLAGNTDKIQRIFGSLMILTALALFTGADRRFQTWVLDIFPNYGTGLTAIEEQDSVRKALESRYPDSKGTIPDFSVDSAANENWIDPLSLGSGVWINSPPLASTDLVGKVVLIDFWTYSCINCLRTLPYFRAWHEKYAEAGLVIIGVHSPEFAFERSEMNVRKAVSSLAVSWPVVMDNDFGIWQAYSNRYWPAHYLYGTDGRLVQKHFGEGAYEETERLIQGLLGISSTVTTAGLAGSSPIAKERSPETYLGYGRMDRFSSPEPIQKDLPWSYSIPLDGMALDHWALEGTWTLGYQSVVPEAGSVLAFHFEAAEVYLVLNPLPGEPVQVFVTVDGRPAEGIDVQAGILNLDADRLYRIFQDNRPVSGTIRVEFRGRAEVYAFTFG
jgi:cytochrome c biogenesis protein CcdA/thiol-disulfide isomerase/thioredoxin